MLLLISGTCCFIEPWASPRRQLRQLDPLLVLHHIGKSLQGYGVFDEGVEIGMSGSVSDIAAGKLGNLREGDTINLHGCVWSAVRRDNGWREGIV